MIAIARIILQRIKIQIELRQDSDLGDNVWRFSLNLLF
jgi:hypothetical protein